MNNRIGKEDAKVFAAYLAVCIIWGSTYLAMRIGVSEFPPELFAGIRFVTAGLLVLVYTRLKGNKFPDSFKDIRRISTVGLLLILGANGLVIWVEQWVHSGITALILATCPLFMALLELFLPGGSSMWFGGWLGLLIGFGGVSLLVLSTKGSGVIDIPGALILILAAFSWAVGSVYSKSFKPSGSILTNLGIQMVAGGMGQCITGIILGELPRVQFTSKGIGAMVYLILIGSIVGYGSFTYLIQKWPAARAGTYAYVNPVVAVVLGALILNEPVGLGVVASTLIILIGVLLVQLSKTTRNKEV